jgi:hypothetical protein
MNSFYTSGGLFLTDMVNLSITVDIAGLLKDSVIFYHQKARSADIHSATVPELVILRQNITRGMFHLKQVESVE